MYIFQQLHNSGVHACIGNMFTCTVHVRCVYMHIYMCHIEQNKETLYIYVHIRLILPATLYAHEQFSKPGQNKCVVQVYVSVCF